jgi:t-SNARE complex subunit (syntaxin)
MPEFFEEVGQIKNLLSLLRNNVRLLQEIYHRQAVTADFQKNSIEIERLLDSSNLTAGQIRTRLNKLKQETASLPAENPQKKTRTNLHGTLTKKFFEIQEEYNTVQINYKNQYREKIERQAQIIKPDVTREEIEHVMQGETDFFTVDDDSHMQAKNALMEIQEQQRGLQQLEKGFQELNQLFIELRATTEVKSEAIADILSNTSNTVMYSQEAVVSVTKAEEYASQRRKRIILITSSFITILLIVMGIAVAIIINNCNCLDFIG